MPRKLNPHLTSLENDVLYHIDLNRKIHDFKEMFGDVKFICLGGSPKRMLRFALFINKHLELDIPEEVVSMNLSEGADRYAMYKIGPVLSVNHGMGCPSLSILLNELIKLVEYAGCKDVTFFRMGTSGGLGINPGTVIVTQEVVDGMFRNAHHQIILGKEVVREAKCDKELVEEIVALGNDANNNVLFDIIRGKTMCCHDFYEGQARIDGAFCEYTLEEKKRFLTQCFENGVTNFEMESLGFASILHHAKFRFGIVCVALLDRLHGDQVAMSHEKNVEFQERPFYLVGQFIKKKLQKSQANGQSSSQ